MINKNLTYLNLYFHNAFYARQRYALLLGVCDLYFALNRKYGYYQAISEGRICKACSTDGVDAYTVLV
jgi:hypothetical protein